MKTFVNLSLLSPISHSKLGLTKVSKLDITTWHRLGAAKRQPTTVRFRFATLLLKAEIWSDKAKLKGSPVARVELLTRRRQELFVAALFYFGFQKTQTSERKTLL